MTNTNVNRAKYLLLGLLVYLNILQSSFSGTSDLNFSKKIIGYIPLFIMIGLTIIEFIFTKGNVYNYICYLSYALLAVIFIIRGSNSLTVGVWFLLGFSSWKLEINGILKTYGLTILISCITVITLAFMHKLPMYDNSGYGLLSYGFGNPNTLGFYVTLLVLIFIYFYWAQSVYKVLVPVIISFVLVNFKLYDHTASLVILTMFLFYLANKINPKIFASKILRFFNALLPIILALFAYFVGKNFGRYNFISELNQLVRMRPQIWNYYLFHYPIRLFGSVISNPIQMGANYTVGQGAFDGSYIYYPVKYGLIATAIVLLLLCVSIFKAQKANNFSLVAFLIAMTISGFSESLLFNSFQSPIIMMACLIFASVKNKKFSSELTIL